MSDLHHEREAGLTEENMNDNRLRGERFEDNLITRARDEYGDAALIDREHFSALHYGCTAASRIDGVWQCRCAGVPIDQLGRIWLKGTFLTEQLIRTLNEAYERLPEQADQPSE